MNLYPGYKFLKANFIRATKTVSILVSIIKLYLLLLKCVFLLLLFRTIQLQCILLSKRKQFVIYLLLQSSKPILHGDVTSTTFLFLGVLFFPPISSLNHGYNYFTKYHLSFLETTFPSFSHSSKLQVQAK